MPSYRANIKPELLRWARETIGLSPERAADRLAVRVENLLAWESGERAPTVNQLRAAANIYKRPLAVFFLQHAPPSPLPIHDFRRVPGEEETILSPAVLLEVRKARRRRSLALELASELGDTPPAFTLRASENDDPDQVAARARDAIGLTLAAQTRWIGEYQPLNEWTAALEALGILVFQASRVDVAEMRGFSLSEAVLPVIMLNGADRPRGRIFTLMHEFVHLMLHESGVCDPLKNYRRVSTNARIETFCNRVAGAILVPREALLTDPVVSTTPGRPRWSDADIGAIADRFGVSREVVLRRLVIVDRATQEYYEEKRQEYQAAYAELRKQKRKSSGGPSPSRMAIRNNGRPFTRLVLDALEREIVSSAAFADYLGVGIKHLARIDEQLRRGAIEDVDDGEAE